MADANRARADVAEIARIAAACAGMAQIDDASHAVCRAGANVTINPQVNKEFYALKPRTTPVRFSHP